MVQRALAIARVLFALDESSPGSAAMYISKLAGTDDRVLHLTRYIAWCQNVIGQNESMIGVLGLHDPWNTNSHTSGAMSEFYPMLVGYGLCVHSAVQFWTEATGLRVLLTALGERADCYMYPEQCSGPMKNAIRMYYASLTGSGGVQKSKMASIFADSSSQSQPLQPGRPHRACAGSILPCTNLGGKREEEQPISTCVHSRVPSSTECNRQRGFEKHLRHRCCVQKRVHVLHGPWVHWIPASRGRISTITL